MFYIYIGETISEKDKCKECKGKKVTQQTKVLEVHVDKGMKDNQKIPFRGEGDQLVSNMIIILFILIVTELDSNSNDYIRKN